MDSDVCINSLSSKILHLDSSLQNDKLLTISSSYFKSEIKFVHKHKHNQSAVSQSEFLFKSIAISRFSAIIDPTGQKKFNYTSITSNFPQTFRI